MSDAIAHIRKKLPPRAAALVGDPVSRRYLTGFDASDGLVLVTKESALFLTDSRYIEAARAAVTACAVEEGYDRLGEELKRRRVKKILLETGRTTLSQARRWQADYPRAYVDLRARQVDSWLRGLREVKSQAEIEQIKRAQRIAEAAFAQVLDQLREGMSERELALALDYAMLRGGADALSFETIVAAGENGSKPHAVPGAREIRRGDLITMDFGAVVDGYHSDMTRTVALGEPGARQREIYGVVLAAQKAALASLRPGLPCKAADAAARDVIKAAGFGDQFRHGTGHGVGLEVHESPSLSSKSGGVLRPGMVVTVEPGIYLPGECGVRIEDMAVITETGCENLAHTNKELLVL